MITGLLERTPARGVARCWTSVWDAVTAHLRAKRDVRIERLWNEGTAAAIAVLPPGAELEERSPDGGYRHLRVPVVRATGTLAIASSPARRQRPS